MDIYYENEFLGSLCLDTTSDNQWKGDTKAKDKVWKEYTSLNMSLACIFYNTMRNGGKARGFTSKHQPNYRLI